MADEIRATPRSPLFGLFSDIVNVPLDYMSSPQRTQQMQGLASFIRGTGVPSTLQNLSYDPTGRGLFTGAGGLGGTTRMRPEAIEAALTLAPGVGPVARLTRGLPVGMSIKDVGGSYFMPQTGQSKTATLFDDWLKTSTNDQGTRNVFNAINRRAKENSNVDFELRFVKTSDAFPTQSGEDYINGSSIETAKKIARSKSIKDIDRVEDVLPIRLDENMRIIDGNHRHAAAVMNNDEYIQALVPVGKGTGKVINIDSIMQSIKPSSSAQTEALLSSPRVGSPMYTDPFANTISNTTR
jgi:hypothetical protein